MNYKKMVLTIIICVLMTAVLVVMGLFSFPYKQIIMSAVSTAMFVGFAFLLRAASPKTKARRFFKLSGIRFRDFGLIFWSALLLVAGTFLLNILTSLFCDAVGLESSVSGLSKMDSENYIIVLVSVAVIPAFTEEFFFRGAVLSTLAEKGVAFSVILSSVLFTLMHGLDIYFLPTFFAGLVLAFVARATASVFAAALVHLINNILTYILWIYAERLALVRHESIMVYAAVFCFLLSAYFMASSASRRLKKSMYKKRNILNEGEIVWAKNQEKQGKD